MERSDCSQIAVGAFAIFIVANVLTVSYSQVPSPPEAPARATAADVFGWTELHGTLDGKAKANTGRIELVGKIRLEHRTSIHGYATYRRVYAISGEKHHRLRDVTHICGVLERNEVLFYPSHSVDDPLELKLSAWDFAPSIQDGQFYLITSWVVITFSNGEKAVCHFDPVVVDDGKVVVEQGK